MLNPAQTTDWRANAGSHSPARAPAHHVIGMAPSPFTAKARHRSIGNPRTHAL